MLNRIMSLGLALALFVSSPASVFAVDASDMASVETNVENTSEETAVATEGESVSDEEAAVTQDEISESGDADEASQTTSDESTSEEKDSKTEEKLNKEETEKSASSEKASKEQQTEAKEEKTEEEKAKENKELTEKESEEETSYSYKSNGDGTHVKSWTDEEGTEHSEEEACEFDENGVCLHCGYEKEEDATDEEYRLSGAFTIECSGYSITAEVPEGAYDEKVKLAVAEVELSDEEKSLVDDELSQGIAISYVTFDIGFVNKKGDKLEPKDSVHISISSPKIIEDSEIIHIDDEGTAENITAEASEGEIEFEAESFSKYTVAGVEYDVETQKVLYYNTAYGTAFSSYKFNKNTSETIGNKSYGVQVQYAAGYIPFAPVQTDESNHRLAYVFGSGCGGYIDVHFFAPENYYIEKIETSSYSSSATYTPEEEYATEFEPKIALTQGQTTLIKVSLEKIPTTFTDETTIVGGATIANYVNGTSVFGSTFNFNWGNGTGSNVCHYAQVYQGLASSTIGTTFKLATDNGVSLFPEKIDTSYLTDLRSNVGVEFKKDTDGYWTLDSKYYKYVYNSSSNKTNDSNGVIEATEGEGFWPFQSWGNNDIHYGMELPISFRVNSDGSTTDANGNKADTIFKFSGDDDVFVYVDGNLVLDLGGIHNAVSGQINFRTGDILIQGYSQNEDALTSSIDENNSAYANKKIGTTNLYDILSAAGVAKNVTELSKNDHVLTVVYFERGANVSNCKISYNFVKNETTTVSYEGLKVKSGWHL